MQRSLMHRGLQKISITTLVLTGLIMSGCIYRGARAARQAEGKTYLGSITRGQQAFFLENGTFGTTINALDIGISLDSNAYYTLAILEADDTQTIAAATARAVGLKSYVSAVFAIGETETVSNLCETYRPSTVPAPAPKLVGTEVVCAEGTTALY